MLQWRRLEARHGGGARSGPRRRTLSTEVPASGTVQRRQLSVDAERAAAVSVTDAEQLTVTSLLGTVRQTGGDGGKPDLIQDTAT